MRSIRCAELVRRADASLKLASRRRNVQELPERARLFRRRQLRHRNGAARHGYARRSMGARDRNVFRPATGSVKSTRARRAGKSAVPGNRRIGVARPVGRIVIARIVIARIVIGPVKWIFAGRERQAPCEKPLAVMAREFMKSVRPLAMHCASKMRTAAG